MPLLMSREGLAISACGSWSRHPKDPPTDPPTPSLGSDRFYTDETLVAVSEDPLKFIKKAFSTALSKEKWAEGTATCLIAPKMEASMKEALRRQHSHPKTKDVLSFDDGLSEQQAPCLVVACPLVAALNALDTLNEEGEGPDADTIKE